jgi:acetylxylan esterase
VPWHQGNLFKDEKELIMSLHGSPRFVRYLVSSLLVFGLIVVAAWTIQQHTSTTPKAHAAAGSLVQVTNFGTNPTNLSMYLYVPPSVKAHPAILLALHYCTGTGPAFFSGTEFANLADQYGFIVIYPSTPNNGNCWDVFSSKGLVRNGGSDQTGLISMITYVEQHNNGDSSNVYVTGASSGAMMTDVMLAEYPDVFKAGSAFMGVPYHCFATTDGSSWNSACANGQISMTPQQWGDLVRNTADPGYSGARPRVQLFHGTADTTLNYNNFGEEIKQWTNVLGVSQTPSFTDTPQSGWTRTRYGGTGVNAPVEGVSVAGVGHSLPLSGQAAMAIQFMGLNNSTPTTPTAVPTNTPTSLPGTPTPTRTPTNTPVPTNTPTPGTATCKVTYAIQSQWTGGFTANLTIADTGTSAINGWTLKFAFPASGQSVTQGWNATWSQSGLNVTATNLSYNGAIAAGGSVSVGFNGAWSGSNPAPTSFTLNGATCTAG